MIAGTEWVHRPGRLALRLGAVAAIIVLVHVIAIGVYFGEVKGLQLDGLKYWHIAIFDLDEEESFGTWFSTLLLFFTGFLTLAHARRRRECNDAWHPCWLVLGIGFCFMSLDEVVGLHEYMNSLMEETPWTTVGAWIALVVGVSYLPLLWHLRWRTGLLFAAAGALFLGGALGVERATDWYAEADLLNTLPYNLWNAVEEGLEMAGPILYVYALLDHVRRTENAAAVS